ncbi:MAG: recombinase family protein [Proteobacteria bacterium]|nr:recombinase family protein [Pseudomonadota bacterium]
MKIIAYLRVSTNTQDLNNQKFEILNYTNKNNLKVDEFIDVEASSRKDSNTRRITELMSKVKDGDMIITAELSRLGRSIVEVINIVNELITRNIRLVVIKQSLDIKGSHDMQSKILITLFSLLAELERDLISERTKSALHAAKISGKVLGRPKGSISKSKLDGKEDEIRILLQKKISKSAIARILDTSRTNLTGFMRKRKFV